MTAADRAVPGGPRRAGGRRCWACGTRSTTSWATWAEPTTQARAAAADGGPAPAGRGPGRTMPVAEGRRRPRRSATPWPLRRGRPRCGGRSADGGGAADQDALDRRGEPRPVDAGRRRRARCLVAAVCEPADSASRADRRGTGRPPSRPRSTASAAGRRCGTPQPPRPTKPADGGRRPRRRAADGGAAEAARRDGRRRARRVGRADPDDPLRSRAGRAARPDRRPAGPAGQAGTPGRPEPPARPAAQRLGHLVRRPAGPRGRAAGALRRGGRGRSCGKRWPPGPPSPAEERRRAATAGRPTDDHGRRGHGRAAGRPVVPCCGAASDEDARGRRGAADRVGAAYREWRGERIERLVGDYAPRGVLGRRAAGDRHEGRACAGCSAAASRPVPTATTTPWPARWPPARSSRPATGTRRPMPAADAWSCRLPSDVRRGVGSRRCGRPRTCRPAPARRPAARRRRWWIVGRRRGADRHAGVAASRWPPSTPTASGSPRSTCTGCGRPCSADQGRAVRLLRRRLLRRARG